MRAQNYQSTITQLYFLLISADGRINESEVAFGEKLIQLEGFGEVAFRTQMDELKGKDASAILMESLMGLKKLSQKEQIHAIAWLCAVANADGFMDRKEWQLIYTIYHKELGLALDAIMKEQKEINQLVRQTRMMVAAA